MRRPALRRTEGYWAVAYAFFMVFVGTNLAAPLYPVYSRLWHFSAGILTLIFAIYALVLIPSLLVFGHLSDYVGRRRILLLGMFLAAVGSILFAAAQGVGWLFAARILQGVAVGMISGTATAALTELQPKGDRARAALVASVVATGGGGVGALMGGLMAEYAPYPLILSYVVQLVLLGIAVLAIWMMPEPLAERPGGTWRIEPPAVPQSIRVPFALASAAAFVSWAVASLLLAIVPSYADSLLHLHSLALTGGVAALMFVASALVQVLLRRLPPEPAMGAGSLLLIAGLAGIVLASPLQAASILLGGAVLAGFGHGLAFMGATALINAVAPSERRGNVLSAYFAVNYLGAGVPILGVGFGSVWLGLYGAVVAFAIVIGCMCLAVLLSVWLVSERAGEQQAWNDSAA